MKSDLETLKAWCWWKRKELERCNTFIDPDGELDLVKAVEDTISQVGTWKAKFEREAARVRELQDQQQEFYEKFVLDGHEIGRLREALGFYSHGNKKYSYPENAVSDYHFDDGKIAREALQEKKRSGVEGHTLQGQVAGTRSEVTSDVGSAALEGVCNASTGNQIASGNQAPPPAPNHPPVENLAHVKLTKDIIACLLPLGRLSLCSNCMETNREVIKKFNDGVQSLMKQILGGASG